VESKLAHIQVNVAAANLPFYRDLMGFLGWQTLYEDEGMFGVGSGESSLWFIGAASDAKNDYDGAGMNHLGIGVARQEDVDTVVGYLRERGVPALFETPRHRPEFSQDETSTYYQVMFESPDRVLFEVVYTGPKAG
jgi:catechol 2,3-dioxygenase-like lactoylglutathione lyase family enzyme